MEFSKIIFLAKYVHYEVLNTKYFLRFFTPFFFLKSALEICHFYFLLCFLKPDFLMGVVPVMSCRSSTPCPIVVSNSVLECCVLPGCSN